MDLCICTGVYECLFVKERLIIHTFLQLVERDFSMYYSKEYAIETEVL